MLAENKVNWIRNRSDPLVAVQSLLGMPEIGHDQELVISDLMPSQSVIPVRDVVPFCPECLGWCSKDGTATMLMLISRRVQPLAEADSTLVQLM